MSINRYISFLFMLITVLSGQPQDSIGNLKNVRDLSLYKGIIKTGLELQQYRQSFKTYDNMLFAANNSHKNIEHEKHNAIVNGSFSINKTVFEHYLVKLDYQAVISLQRNDAWKHTVF